jgi:hypothetical protein
MTLAETIRATPKFLGLALALPLLAAAPAARADVEPPASDMGTPPPPSSDEGGCVVSARVRHGALGAVVSSVAVAALVVARRRHAPR